MYGLVAFAVGSWIAVARLSKYSVWLVGREPEAGHPLVGETLGRGGLNPPELLVVAVARDVFLAQRVEGCGRNLGGVDLVVRRGDGRAVRQPGRGERAGLRVHRRTDADHRPPVEVHHPAPRERRADAEVLEQLVVEAGDHFVRRRRLVAADLVEDRVLRIGEIEPGPVGDVVHRLAELADVGDLVAVGVLRVEVDVAVGYRVDRRRGAVAQLRREHRVAGAHLRLAALVERVGQARRAARTPST